MKNQTIVIINDKEVVIKRLALGKYAELLGAIKELPKHLQSFTTTTPEKVIDILPAILSQSFPDFVNILSIATNIEPSEIEELGLDDAVKLTIAVIQVNKFAEVYETIKKAIAQAGKVASK